MINSAFIFLVVLIFTIFILVLNIDKLLISLFSKKEEIKYKKICPKCASTNIKVDFSNPVVWDMGTPSKYICKSCSHMAYFFPEVSANKIKDYQSEFKKELAKGSIHFSGERTVDIAPGYNVGRIEIFFMFVTILILLTYVLFSFD